MHLCKRKNVVSFRNLLNRTRRHITAAVTLAVGLSVSGLGQSSFAPGFVPPVSYASGGAGAGSLIPAVADFNGDGVQDLAVANVSNATISVLFGKPDGTFQAPVAYSVGTGPYGIAAGDFNGDGKPDLAIVNSGDGTVSILLNAGGGIFPQTPSYTYTVGSTPYGISVADFNKDGHLDLAVTNNASQTVSVLFGKGDGTFQPAIAFPVGKYPYGTAVGDFNHDGFLDLVVWNIADSTVGVLLNDKAGGFLPQVTYATGLDPYSVSVDDFDGDGFPDLAVANIGANTVSVLLNDKTGKFLPQVTYATGIQPTSVVARDFNGDGIADLVVTNLIDGTVSLLLGKGDGTFLPQSTYPAGTQPYAAVAADFNGDGRPDLAITNFVAPSIAILLQNRFSSPAKLVFTTEPVSTSAGSPITVSVAIEDALGEVVTTATGAITIALGSNASGGVLSGTLTVNATNGVATFPGLSISSTGTGYTFVASSTGLPSATSTAFDITPPTITIALQGGSVGIGTSLSGTVTLGQPAPAGGVSVSLSSSNTTAVTLSPNAVTIAGGGTSASFTYSGVATGSANLSASAPGYATGTATVTATSSAISLGATGPVTVGSTVSLPITLNTPAPSGGVTVSLTSSNLSVATVTTGIFIPAGATVPVTGSQLTGLALGTTQITATAPGYAPGVESVTIIAPTANLTPTPFTIAQFGYQYVILTISAPAPPSGTIFTITTDDASIAAPLSSSATVSPGMVSVSIPVSGIGIGTTTLHVNSPGITEAIVQTKVVNAPLLNIFAVRQGNNTIMPLSVGVQTSSAPQVLTVTSGDPTHFLLSTDPAVVGSASVTVNLPPCPYICKPSIYVEGRNFAGSSSITATLTATSAGYSTGTGSVSLYPSGFSLEYKNIGLTYPGSPRDFYADFDVLTPGSLSISDYGTLGPQAAPVQLIVTSSDTSIATVSGSPVAFTAGSQYSTLSVNPAGIGSTELTLAEPAGYNAPSPKESSLSLQLPVTVSGYTPHLSWREPRVVGNLQITSTQVYFDAATVAQQLVLTSSDPTHLLLSGSATAVGTKTLTVALAAGQSVYTVYLEGQNYTGTAAIPITVTASIGQYPSATETMSLYPSGVFIYPSGSATTTTASYPTQLQVELVTLMPGTLLYYAPYNASLDQSLGPQASPLSIVVTSSDPSVGTISGSPATIAVGTFSTSTFLYFNPVGPGVTTISVAQPPGYQAKPPTSSFGETVTIPALQMTNVIVGNNTVTAEFVLLSASISPAAVTVTSSDPTHFLLSRDYLTLGTASLTISPVNGAPVFIVQGQNYSGNTAITATLTATAAGYTTATATASLYPTGFGFGTNSFTTTTNAAPTEVVAYLDILTPGTLTDLGIANLLGPQAPPVAVTVTSSNPAVGTITGSPAPIPVGLGLTTGVYFNPLSAGTSTINLVQPAGYFIPSTVYFQQETASVIGGAAAVALSATTNQATVKAGEAAHFSLLVTAPASTNQPLLLSCGNLPVGATCTFSPASVIPSPAGAHVDLTITTTAPPPSLASFLNWKTGSESVLACVLLFGIRKRRLAVRLAGLFVLLSSIGLAGCASGGVPPASVGTPVGAKAITVLATPASGGPGHQLQIMLVVTP